jgi:hypothetical protein
MTEIIIYLSIITLKVNGLNSPIVRNILADWIKIKCNNLLPTRNTSHCKDKHKKVKRIEKDIPRKWNPKVSRNRYNHILKRKTQTKTSHKKQRMSLHIDNGTIHEDDIMIINIYAPNLSAHNFIKQILMDIRAQIDLNTIIVDDLNILL